MRGGRGLRVDMNEGGEGQRKGGTGVQKRGKKG